MGHSVSLGLSEQSAAFFSHSIWGYMGVRLHRYMRIQSLYILRIAPMLWTKYTILNTHAGRYLTPIKYPPNQPQLSLECYSSATYIRVVCNTLLINV